jgi:hypothetical protein
MKKPIALLIFMGLLSTIVSAENTKLQDTTANNAKFEQHKQHVLTRIDQRRACIAAAQNNEQLKNCANKQATDSRDSLFKGTGTDSLQ